MSDPPTDSASSSRATDASALDGRAHLDDLAAEAAEVRELDLPDLYDEIDPSEYTDNDEVH